MRLTVCFEIHFFLSMFIKKKYFVSSSKKPCHSAPGVDRLFLDLTTRTTTSCASGALARSDATSDKIFYETDRKACAGERKAPTRIGSPSAMIESGRRMGKPNNCDGPQMALLRVAHAGAGCLSRKKT